MKVSISYVKAYIIHIKIMTDCSNHANADALRRDQRSEKSIYPSIIPAPNDDTSCRVRCFASREGSEASFTRDCNASHLKVPIIIISSKELSKRAQSVLTDTGALSIFNPYKYSAWSVKEFITINTPDFVFFNINDPLIMNYISCNFHDIPNDKIVIMKHSHEDLNEPWINAIKKSSPNASIISHIPEIRNIGVLATQLLNHIPIPEPVSRFKKIFRGVLTCIISVI